MARGRDGKTGMVSVAAGRAGCPTSTAAIDDIRPVRCLFAIIKNVALGSPGPARRLAPCTERRSRHPQRLTGDTASQATNIRLSDDGRYVMNMQQIRYFLAVSENRNFRRAAQRCKVAQPSVTNAIKSLERELGGPLFWRKRPRIELSALGYALLPHFA